MGRRLTVLSTCITPSSMSEGAESLIRSLVRIALGHKKTARFSFPFEAMSGPVASLYSDVSEIRVDGGGRFMRSHIRVGVMLGLVAAVSASALAQGTTADADIKAAVIKQISGIDYGGRRPTVTVSGGAIMLS